MKSILILFISLFALQSRAQDELNIFANRTEVRRISNALSAIKRPMLSLNTLYSANNYQKGYDLEFVLNNLHLHSVTLTAIFNDANEPIKNNPEATSDIDQNSRILEHWAFKALTTYVRTQVKTVKNEPIGNIPGGNISLEFDPVNTNNFLTALKQSRSHYLVSENSNGVNDYVKWAQSLANYARAIDLYLAFEVAVMTYQPQLETQLLLSMAEKEALLS